MKKGFIYWVFSILLIGFCCGACGHQSPKYVHLAHKITDDTAVALLKEKNLITVGTGGKMMDDIQAMHMGFYYYQEEVDLNKARELLVYAISEYLSAINSNEDVRPYLHEYPFTAKNVEIQIWFYKPDGHYPELDKIEYCSAIDGLLKYYNPGPNRFTAIHKETYDEALKNVQKIKAEPKTQN